MEWMTTPPKIGALLPGEVFVFGSNLAGIHGKGAALTAKQFYGAIQGVTTGMQGRSYAIPTKNDKLEPLPLYLIQPYVRHFFDYAWTHRDKTFLVTKIGCGEAGYKPEEMMAIFPERHRIPPNVALPQEFWACFPRQ